MGERWAYVLGVAAALLVIVTVALGAHIYRWELLVWAAVGGVLFAGLAVRSWHE